MRDEATFRQKLVDVLGTALGGGFYDSSFYSPAYYNCTTGDYARVFPVTGEQDGPRPMVTYELDSLLPEWTLGGETDGKAYTFAVNIYSRHYFEAATLAQALVNSMANLRDADVRGCFLTGQRGQSVADDYCYQLTWKVILNDG